MANGYDPSAGALLSPETQKLLARRDAVLGPAYRLFYDEPVVAHSAKGVWITGEGGRQFLDAYNNVPVIGHSHPAVTEAVTAQLATLNTHTRYLTEPIVDYTERLLSLFPSGLDRVTFTCTGSEAVDLALRIAQYETGNTGVIISAHAYHGTTHAAAQISPALGDNNVLGPHVVTIPSIDTLRTPTGEIRPALLTALREAIAELQSRGVGLAAVIFDSIFSSDGVQPEPVDVLGEVVKLTHEAGGLYIADEVQPGFGRTGTWWGFERHAIVPDLVVLGKPMGNGLPIAAVVGRSECQEKFGSELRYFNTFGGNPVSIAAASAVLDTIMSEGLVEHAANVGAFLLNELRTIQQRYTQIPQVRGAGLFLAMDFVTDPESLTPDPELASAVVNGMRSRGVLISASGPDAASLKIRPPLVITREEVAQLVTTLEATLVDVGCR